MSRTEVTLQHNWYSVLGLPLGAPISQARAAYERLVPSARAEEDSALVARLEEAYIGLTHEGSRQLHHERIRWAATAEWYRRKYPNGRGVEEHRLWADYLRAVPAEPPRRRRLRGVAAS